MPKVKWDFEENETEVYFIEQFIEQSICDENGGVIDLINKERMVEEFIQLTSIDSVSKKERRHHRLP